MLLRLHIYRCTAQVDQCRAYYEELTRVDGEYLEWRDIVISNKLPRLLYVQPNSYIEDGVVTVKEYDATCEGIIKSWAERSV
jgi:dipeptidyl-peptidase III